MTPDRLRAAFAAGQPFAWEGESIPVADQTGAAVLIAVVCDPRLPTQLAPKLATHLVTNSPHILLTRRTDHLYHHPGQISFPGGRIEAGESALEAALRESEEEIGLAPQAVEILGALPRYATLTGFCITPVVGLVHETPELRCDEFEVAEVFGLPLQVAADLSRYQRHRAMWRGDARHFHALPHAGRFIWGATAGMLMMLAAFMGRS